MSTLKANYWLIYFIILELNFIFIIILLIIKDFLFSIMFMYLWFVLKINKDDFIYSQDIENLRHTLISG